VKKKCSRRLFLLTAVALSPALFTSHARPQTRRIASIGYLTTRALEFEKRWLGAFREGMRELGYSEGRNLLIVERHAAGQPAKVSALAAELVQLKVDVIVASESISSVEAKKATSTIPIVSLSQDPVALGLVASLARPGGNVTGMSDYHAGMASKRLELLKEVAPAALRFAVFINPAIRPNLLQLEDLQAVARAMGVTVLPFDIQTADDIDRAFAAMPGMGAQALVLLPGGAISSHQKRIAELAMKARLPAIFTVSTWAEVGGLMAYGTDFTTYYRRAATHVDKILRGAKPGDLPIEQPTKFDLVVNLKTAKAIGITIPQSVLARADRVIK
jgi:putative tryptophan/tyrosine transport system substrate-binding protein